MNAPHQVLRTKSHFHPAAVHRAGGVVIRDAGPWAPTVHALLRHLEEIGFAGAPRVVGSGFDAEGRETLSYREGEFVHPGPWTLEGAASVGVLLRQLHAATASFRAPHDAVWYPWFGRALGGAERVIGHCDVAPWNIVARDGRAVALIDWDRAGPVDPLVELAQACWLNAKLHDDLVAQRERLPPVAERARQLRAIVDGYGLSAAQRRAWWTGSSNSRCTTPRTRRTWRTSPPRPRPTSSTRRSPGALAWRVRAAAWQLRQRKVLERALA